MDKATVLSEICRITEENGKVPGLGVFEQLSGIHRREIIGKFWARWGDALAEAGFAANAFGSERYDDQQVLESVAQVALSLKRWPSPIDLRMYARANEGFMSATTIANHYPKRSQLVEAMREWASCNDPSGQILSWLPHPTNISSVAGSSLPLEGHVYLIRAGDFYKIGRSDEIERRVKEIRIALPQAATLEHTIATDDPPGIEAYWHRRFADKRANGEWFKLEKSDVLAFKKRRFQ